MGLVSEGRFLPVLFLFEEVENLIEQPYAAEEYNAYEKDVWEVFGGAFVAGLVVVFFEFFPVLFLAVSHMT